MVNTVGGVADAASKITGGLGHLVADVTGQAL